MPVREPDSYNFFSDADQETKGYIPTVTYAIYVYARLEIVGDKDNDITLV